MFYGGRDDQRGHVMWSIVEELTNGDKNCFYIGRDDI